VARTPSVGQTVSTNAALGIDGMFRALLGDTFARMAEIPDGSIDMVLADLPYGTSKCKWDSVIPFEPLWAAYKRVCKPNAAIVLTAAQPFTSALVMSNTRMFKYSWIWKKTKARGHLNAWKMPMRDHEDVLVFCSKQTTYNPQITDKPKERIRPQTARSAGSDCYGKFGLSAYRCPADKSMPKSVLTFTNAQNTVHPTQKPVALMEYLIRTYTNPGDLVLDNVMGSGTTGVAAIRASRRFVGIERDKKYFEIACKRLRNEKVEVTP